MKKSESREEGAIRAIRIRGRGAVRERTYFLVEGADVIVDLDGEIERGGSVTRDVRRVRREGLTGLPAVQRCPRLNKE